MFSYRAPWMNCLRAPEKLVVYKWCVVVVVFGVWYVGR